MTTPSDALHVDERGRLDGDDPTTFVLLHGYAASSYTWRHWVPALEERGRVLSVDLKGFGRSAKADDGRYGPHDHVETVVDLLDDRAAEGVTLIGHSFGGGVALLSALALLRRGESPVTRLVVVAGAAYRQRLPPFVAAARYPRLSRAVVDLVGAHNVIRLALRAIVADPETVEDGQVEAYAQGLRSREGLRAALDTARAIVPPDLDALAARYPTITAPTLLLWGRRDRVVPLWVGRRLAAELPRARLEILDRCGHVPQEERPVASRSLLLHFLDHG